MATREERQRRGRGSLFSKLATVLELRLVVDQLDENDAFAFALTCRELPRRRLPRRLDHRPLR